jgi:diaminopimelate epimerase
LGNTGNAEQDKDTGDTRHVEKVVDFTKHEGADGFWAIQSLRLARADYRWRVLASRRAARGLR